MKHWVIKIIILAILATIGVLINEVGVFNEYILGFIVGALIQAIMQIYDIFTVKPQTDQK